MKKLKFEELSLSSEILQAVTDMGFVEASPIQSEAIPYIMEGRDVIGQAQTGTGKTAAFAIPALEMIDDNDKSVQALVLCPTRELAVQVADEFKKLGKYKKGINSVAIYGGDSIEKQILALRRGGSRGNWHSRPGYGPYGAQNLTAGPRKNGCTG
jgi:ATP-dependent RNA helicase DeaD